MIDKVPKAIRNYAFSALVSIVGLGMSVAQLYTQSYGTNAVIIASSPGGAVIQINGKDLGKTPLTTELMKGTYTILATRNGYKC